LAIAPLGCTLIVCATIVVVLYLYRKPLWALIDRALTAKTPWGEISFQPQELASQVVLSEPPVDSSIDVVVTRYPTMMFPTKTAPSESAEADQELRESLAATTEEAKRWATAWDFERTYNRLYGSQLTLMLVMDGPGTRSPANVRQYYELGANNGLGVSFEQWLQVLLDGDLITQFDGGGGINVFQITPKGTQFVKYMHDQNLSNAKPF